MTCTKSPAVIREASEFRVTDPKLPVKILENFIDHPAAAIEVITVPCALDRAASEFPDRKALMFKDEVTKEWNGITFKEYKAKVEKIAKVFIKLGLERHGTVAVLAFNCAEWHLSELAAIHAGFV